MLLKNKDWGLFHICTYKLKQSYCTMVLAVAWLKELGHVSYVYL